MPSDNSILTSLRASPQISAVYVGYDNGNFFHILSITESEKAFVEQLGGPPLTRFVIHEIRTDNNGARVQTWLFLASDNRQIGTLSKPSPEYDPRSRDWYRDAMENPKTVVRTLPYLFFGDFASRDDVGASPRARRRCRGGHHPRALDDLYSLD